MKINRIFLVVFIQFVILKAEISCQEPSSGIYPKVAIPSLQSCYCDGFKQIYTLSKGNTLARYDWQGKMAFSYSESRYGAITQADMSNPLSVLVYYGAFGVAQILDRNLVLQSELNLRVLGYQTISAIGLGANNQIWIYDAEKLILVKLDPTGQVSRQSNELIDLIGNNKLEGRIWELDNFLFIRSPGLGWLQFDDYANFVQTLPLPDKDINRMSQEQIWYDDEDGYSFKFDLRTLKTKKYPKPAVIPKDLKAIMCPEGWLSLAPDQLLIFPSEN